MELRDDERAMLEGAQGEALRRAMNGLVQLGEAFDAEDMVRIGYAHVHPGMAMYAKDVELLEELAGLGARVSVPTTVNISNVDTVGWRATAAPESLVKLHLRGVSAHREMGCESVMSCTPYWAGHWPTWNTHMTSIESTVTIFCNSVLGARSNRDGFFSVYAAMTGRYPRFGYHLDGNRIGTHLVTVDARLEHVSDYSALGYHLGDIVGTGVPVIVGLPDGPTPDELDALGATLATTGGVSMFIVPGVTPPFSSLEACLPVGRPVDEVLVTTGDVEGVYGGFDAPDADGAVDFVHLGCPHASFQEMKDYARLLAGRVVKDGVELWITTSRAVRNMAADAGIVAAMEGSGAKVVSDTCPMSCHLATTTSPDPEIDLPPHRIGTMVVDSAKQAKYVRDMIGCRVLFTSSERAVESAVLGRFVPRCDG